MRRILSLCALLLLSTLAAQSSDADVVSTTDGLRLEGKAVKQPDGSWEITTAQGVVQLAATRVKSVTPGVSPRAAMWARAKQTDAKDAVALYKLALEAEQAGLTDIAHAAFTRVIAADPDHRAARRALGFEQVKGAWVRADVARQLQGLVLYSGTWMLPAEVERASRGSVAEGSVAEGSVAGPNLSTSKIEPALRALASDDAPLRDAARLRLTDFENKELVPAALRTLYDSKTAVRVASAKLLGELGDESALRPLIFSSVLDRDEGVRREAIDAAKSFGHDDTAVPLVRALGSENLQVAANAAQALAGLGDPRVVGYIVKRIRSAGSSARSFVAFINQISYVRDYDVEIAQASNIANPDIGTIQEGVVLDVKVVGAVYTKTWIEPILLDSLGSLAGQSFRTADEAVRWYAAHRDRYPGFPEKPAQRAPRKRRGRVVGAPVLD